MIVTTCGLRMGSNPTILTTYPSQNFDEIAVHHVSGKADGPTDEALPGTREKSTRHRNGNYERLSSRFFLGISQKKQL
ncbi:unnamed protein product [Ilex paraguariensis]|uniref:Uncharacterized protein n=1 Tax=Ilex paraguariensis TaxID=185542 RepID=A0ABC8UJU9_9AQUA